eukprot:gene15214-biopygen10079
MFRVSPRIFPVRVIRTLECKQGTEGSRLSVVNEVPPVCKALDIVEEEKEREKKAAAASHSHGHSHGWGLESLHFCRTIS